MTDIEPADHACIAPSPLPLVIVEDSREMSEVLRELVAQTPGLSVAAVMRGEIEATQWLYEHEGGWRVAIIDLLLYDGSGFHLIVRARQAPDAHVIVFSEYVTPVIEQRCLSLGADAVFRKSDFARLARHLQELGARGAQD